MSDSPASRHRLAGHGRMIYFSLPRLGTTSEGEEDDTQTSPGTGAHAAAAPRPSRSGPGLLSPRRRRRFESRRNLRNPRADSGREGREEAIWRPGRPDQTSRNGRAQGGRLSMAVGRADELPVRYAGIDDIVNRVPVSVVWEITLACDLACQHCGS